MGQDSSKPESSRHVFTSSSPVSFSQEVIDSLQNTDESNRTRELTHELHIQARVRRELERLQGEQAKALKDLEAKFAAQDAENNDSSDSSSPSSSSSSSSDPSTSEAASSLLSTLTSPFTGSGSSDGSARADLGRATVQREIDALRAKLERRRLREEAVAGGAAGKKGGEEGKKGKGGSAGPVEEAREALVSCLRKNDRRPLDCWEEVEAFKREVGKVEKGFLGKVLE